LIYCTVDYVIFNALWDEEQIHNFCFPYVNDDLLRIKCYNVAINLGVDWFGSWLLILDFCSGQKHSTQGS